MYYKKLYSVFETRQSDEYLKEIRLFSLGASYLNKIDDISKNSIKSKPYSILVSSSSICSAKRALQNALFRIKKYEGSKLISFRLRSQMKSTRFLISP